MRVGVVQGGALLPWLFDPYVVKQRGSEYSKYGGLGGESGRELQPLVSGVNERNV